MNSLQLPCKKSVFGSSGVILTCLASAGENFNGEKKVVRIVDAFLLGKQRGANARLGKACLRPNGLI